MADLPSMPDSPSLASIVGFARSMECVLRYPALECSHNATVTAMILDGCPLTPLTHGLRVYG